ncbi:MAG: PspC domain-containing protein [Oscillospiraceae bacterium]|nr:PspC domain-containing protein [Oscillospiraceae bacterium]
MNRRVVKSQINKMISGVCGGLADYFNMDPTIMRLLWVVLTFVSFGVGILLYIAAAIIIPNE